MKHAENLFKYLPKIRQQSERHAELKNYNSLVF